MINWLTFYKPLALMPCSQPRLLGWNFPYCNTSTQPFVIYENQAVALIAQLQSGSRAVVRQGVQTGGGTVKHAGPPTLFCSVSHSWSPFKKKNWKRSSSSPRAHSHWVIRFFSRGAIKYGTRLFRLAQAFPTRSQLDTDSNAHISFKHCRTVYRSSPA